MNQTEEFIFFESEELKEIGDYAAYIELKKLNYSNSSIATQFCITIDELMKIVDKFE